MMHAQLMHQSIQPSGWIADDKANLAKHAGFVCFMRLEM